MIEGSVSIVDRRLKKLINQLENEGNGTLLFRNRILLIKYAQ
jgi:hypothetical protein